MIPWKGKGLRGDAPHFHVNGLMTTAIQQPLLNPTSLDRCAGIAKHSSCHGADTPAWTHSSHHCSPLCPLPHGAPPVLQTPPADPGYPKKAPSRNQAQHSGNCWQPLFLSTFPPRMKGSTEMMLSSGTQWDGWWDTAWVLHRTHFPLFSFLQSFSTVFGGGEGRVLVKMLFQRNVLNSAVFSEEKGKTLWQCCYTLSHLFAFVLRTRF